MTSAKDGVSVFCKAQAEMNKIEKQNEDVKKSLNERIKTFRTIVSEELNNKNIDCFELYPDDNDTDPIYFRMKPNVPNMNINHEEMKSALEMLSKEVIHQFAERCENDIPKMIAHSVQEFLRSRNKSKSSTKTLQITSSKERGFEKDTTQVSEETIQAAKNLLSAREELSGIKKTTSEKKKPLVAKQKQVEETVRKALKASDPESMTSKVHMVQNDSEWIYYLRCKEEEKKVPMGIRKIISIIELCSTELLDQQGYSRRYDASLSLDSDFWSKFSERMFDTYKNTAEETKKTSKLSLNRGAPKLRKSGS